jgi:hypothetical protein
MAQKQRRIALNNRNLSFFLGFFLGLNLLWVFASPVGSSPDEPSQIAYSWATITGQTVNEDVIQDASGNSQTSINMPSKLKNYIAPDCYAFRPEISVGECGLPSDEFNKNFIVTSSNMTGYPPTYYLLQGLPLLLSLIDWIPGSNVLLISRLFISLICNGLIFWGIYILKKRNDLKSILPLSLLILSPMTIFLFASINSSGIEIATSFLTVVLIYYIISKLRLGEILPKKDFVILAIAAISFATSRPLSWLWLTLSMGLFLPLINRIKTNFNDSHNKNLLLAFESGVRKIFTFVGSGILIGFLFSLRFFLMRNSEVVATEVAKDWNGINLFEKIYLLFLHFGTILQHNIGVFGWLDTPLPNLYTFTWLIAGTFILSETFRSTSSWLNPVFSIVIVVCFTLVATISEELLSNFGWQGRYLLPMSSAVLAFLIPHFSELLTKGLVRLSILKVAGVSLILIEGLAMIWYLWRNMYGVSIWSTMRIPEAPLPVGDFSWQPPIIGASLFMILCLVFLAFTCKFYISMFKSNSTRLRLGSQ